MSMPGSSAEDGLEIADGASAGSVRAADIPRLIRGIEADAVLGIAHGRRSRVGPRPSADVPQRAQALCGLRIHLRARPAGAGRDERSLELAPAAPPPGAALIAQAVRRLLRVRGEVRRAPDAGASISLKRAVRQRMQRRPAELALRDRATRRTAGASLISLALDGRAQGAAFDARTARAGPRSRAASAARRCRGRRWRTTRPAATPGPAMIHGHPQRRVVDEEAVRPLAVLAQALAVIGGRRGRACGQARPSRRARAAGARELRGPRRRSRRRRARRGTVRPASPGGS